MCDVSIEATLKHPYVLEIWGHDWPTICFSIAYQLRTVFTFFFLIFLTTPPSLWDSSAARDWTQTTASESAKS